MPTKTRNVFSKRVAVAEPSSDSDAPATAGAPAAPGAPPGPACPPAGSSSPAKRAPPPPPTAPEPPKTDFGGKAPPGWLVTAPPALQAQAADFIKQATPALSNFEPIWAPFDGGHNAWASVLVLDKIGLIPLDAVWPQGVSAIRTEHSSSDLDAIGTIHLWPKRTPHTPPGSDTVVWRTVERWASDTNVLGLREWLHDIAPGTRSSWTSQHGRPALRASIPPRFFGPTLVAAKKADLQFEIVKNVDDCTGYITIKGPASSTAFAVAEVHTRIAALGKGCTVVATDRDKGDLRYLVYTTSPLSAYDSFTGEVFGCPVSFVVGDPVAHNGDVRSVIAKGFEDFCAASEPSDADLTAFKSIIAARAQKSGPRPPSAQPTTSPDPADPAPNLASPPAAASPSRAERPEAADADMDGEGAQVDSLAGVAASSVVRMALQPFVAEHRPVLGEIVRRARSINLTPDQQCAAVSKYIANAQWHIERGSDAINEEVTAIKKATSLKTLDTLISGPKPGEAQPIVHEAGRVAADRTFAQAAKAAAPSTAAGIGAFLRPPRRHAAAKPTTRTMSPPTGHVPAGQRSRSTTSAKAASAKR